MKKRSLARVLALVLTLGSSFPAAASQGSGCMPTTGTVSGLTFAQLVNQAFAAVISGNSGASPPATDCSAAPQKGQVWLDTSVTPNIEKRYDGSSWVVVGAIDATNHLWAPPVGGGTASVTAAATTDICAAPSALQTINGTTTITSFGSGSSCVVGITKKLLFNAATPITYNATSLILPGQRDFLASAGDMADATYMGAGHWRVSSITKIDGSSVINPSVPLGTVLYGDFATIPAKTLIGIGQAIARADYPDYLAAVTRSQSGTLTAGNNTITGLASTRGFGPGMPVEGTGVQAGTAILSVTATTIVMSKTAVSNGAQTVTVFLTGYGSGGDSTTIGVKNCVGRTLAGLDPSATNLDTAAALNAPLGVKSRQIARNNLPSLQLGVSVSGTISVNTQVTNIVAGSPTTIGSGNLGNVDVLNPGTATAGIRLSTGANSMTGNTDNLNGGVAQAQIPTVQPTVTAECVVVVLP